MRTYDGLSVVLTEKLHELYGLTPGTAEYRRIERLLGQYCYEAEEYLSVAELRLLKGTLSISGRAWQRYKAAFVAGIPPEANNA